MLQRYLIVWLSLLCLIAFAWPFDPFVATNTTLFQTAQPIPIKVTGLTVLIAVTMFCVGCLLTPQEVNDVGRRWPLVVAGTAIQFIVMPALAWIFGTVCNISPEFRLGVIMVGCVPGAMASNVLTLAARGNVSYSVSLTTCSTLLSPVMVPAALWVTLGATQSLDVIQVGLKLLMEVVGPVIAGHLLCRFVPGIARNMQDFGPVIANLTIIWIIAVVVALNRTWLNKVVEPQYHAQLSGMLTALLGINLLGYLGGYLGGAALRIDQSMRRALTLEVGMQNAGVGTYLVLQLFGDQPAAAIPTAIYTFGCMFTGTLLAQYWRMRGDASQAVPAELPAEA